MSPPRSSHHVGPSGAALDSELTRRVGNGIRLGGPGSCSSPATKWVSNQDPPRRFPPTPKVPGVTYLLAEIAVSGSRPPIDSTLLDPSEGVVRRWASDHSIPAHTNRGLRRTSEHQYVLRRRYRRNIVGRCAYSTWLGWASRGCQCHDRCPADRDMTHLREPNGCY